jgi:hypothetical protein
MLVSSDVEILEHWLHVDSLDYDCLLVLFKDVRKSLDLIFRHVEVLSSCESGVVDSYRGDSSSWNLLDSVSSESSIDVGAEKNVIEHDFWVSGLVLKSEAVELVLSQVEVEHREDACKLEFGDFTLSEFVEVIEELFNSHSLHNNVMLQSSLDV